MPDKDSKAAKIFGLLLAVTGLSHLVAPKFYEPMASRVFPHNTRTHIYINGGIETALGVGIAARPTRKLAVLGFIGYTAYGVGTALRRR